MKLYDADWAPSPRRVRIFLAEKGIAVERQLVDLAAGDHLREPYLSLNPRGTLPALQLDDGEVIADSGAICRYFEALHPEPSLFGRHPDDIARIEAWTRKVDGDGYEAVVYAFRNGNKRFADKALSGCWPPMPQIPELAERGRLMWGLFVDLLESRLKGRDWIAIDAYSYADLSALVAVDFAVATRLSDGQFPSALARWHARVSERPSAKA